MINLEEYIPIGKENAIHQSELARRLSVTPDQAKTIVRQARQQGCQVLSSTCGYWFSDSKFEKSEFVSLMRRQAFTRLKSVKSINDAVNSIEGQMSLTDITEECSEEAEESEQSQEE